MRNITKKNKHLQVTVCEDSCAIPPVLPAQTQWGLSGFLSITEHRAITLPAWCSKLPKTLWPRWWSLLAGQLYNSIFWKIKSTSEMQAGASNIVPKWQRNE